MFPTLSSADFSIYGRADAALAPWLAGVHDPNSLWKVEIGYGRPGSGTLSYVTSVKRMPNVGSAAGAGVADAAYAAIDGMVHAARLDGATGSRLLTTVRRERDGSDAELGGWSTSYILIDQVQVASAFLQHDGGWAWVVADFGGVSIGVGGTGSFSGIERLDRASLARLEFPPVL